MNEKHLRALSNLEAAIALPENDEKPSRLAKAYRDVGSILYRDPTPDNLHQAIVMYNQAIALKPNDTTTYYYRGAAFKSLQRYEEAIQDFNRAIELEPRSAYAYSALGGTFHSLGKYEDAIRAYERFGMCQVV